MDKNISNKKINVSSTPDKQNIVVKCYQKHSRQVEHGNKSYPWSVLNLGTVITVTSNSSSGANGYITPVPVLCV